MSARFNKPPGWPQPPAGWEPAPGWAPDPSWPTAPHGWRLWDIAEVAQARSAAPPRPVPQPRPAALSRPATSPRPATSSRPPQPIGPPRPVMPIEPARPGTAFRPTEPFPPIAPPRASESFRTAEPLPPARPFPAVRPFPAAEPPRTAEPFPPVPPSIANTIFGLSSGTTPASRPASARMVGWGALGLVVLAVAGVTVGRLAAPSTPVADSAQAAAERAITEADAGTALAVLAELNVHRRGPATGYARSKFGSSQIDTDGNGCDQRNDVLRRDLTGKTLKAGTRGCLVLTGTLSDPYSGRRITYLRSTPGRVRIDHVVALGDAWMKGARGWSAAKRAAFATDPLNLQAVGAGMTTGKHGSDAARWLPEAREHQCAYVARQVAVKRKYGMWVSTAERTTIARILTGCPGQELPSDRSIPLDE